MTIKVEEGRFYRTRNGEKVGPARPGVGGEGDFGGERFPWRVGTYTYRDDGRVGWTADEDDLVAEWTEGLRVEAGKHYRTREGKIIGPMEINPEMSHLCGVKGGGLSDLYTDNGRAFSDGREHKTDIISEATPAIKVELGKFYRNREGAKVGPAQAADKNRDVMGDMFGRVAAFYIPKQGAYSADGQWLTGAKNCRRDLVAEWADEPAKPTKPTDSPKPIKVEAGGVYLTANGERVGPMQEHAGYGTFIHRVGDGCTWEPNGKLRFVDSKPPKYAADIVAVVLSEASTAEPKPDADGWIEWGGGPCPVPAGTHIECRARAGISGRSKEPEALRWSHEHGRPFAALGDIVAYRVTKPEPAAAEPAETVHDLKSWVGLFEPIASGAKTHDLRVMDRPYKVGDVCRLREWEPTEARYTGRECRARITYITSGSGAEGHAPCAFSPVALHPGMAVLSIRLEP